MKSVNKTKQELIAELEALRERISELEKYERRSRLVPGNSGEEMDRPLLQTPQRHEAIFVVFDRKLEFVNDGFVELFGVSTEEACSPNFDPMTLVAPESRRFIRELYREACRCTCTTKQINYIGLSMDGLKIECETLLLFISYKWGVAIQGTLYGTSPVNGRIDKALQRRHSDLSNISNVIPTRVPSAEKARAQDPRETKDEMPVWNLFQTFAHYSTNVARQF